MQKIYSMEKDYIIMWNLNLLYFFKQIQNLMKYYAIDNLYNAKKEVGIEI